MALGDGACFGRDPFNEPHTGVSTKRDSAPRHYLVAAALLEKAAAKLRRNENIETVAGDLIPILQIMARTI